MDAVNNFTDAASSLITILGAHFASKAPNKKHPFGYGRTEYLGTLLIAGLILYAGITAFIESVKKIISPETAKYSVVSLIIIAVAVVAKLMLSIYTTGVGKKINSDSLIASGKDALGDVAISLATLISAIIFILTKVSIEAYIGAIIAVIIIKAGIEILKETIDKLLGIGAEAELVRDIKKRIATHENVLGAYDLVLHNYGPDSYLASVHIEASDELSIDEFDMTSREIQEDIFNEFGIYLSAIGVYSVSSHDDEIINMREDIRKLALSDNYIHQMHGFYVDKVKKQMRFDLVVSFEAPDRQAVYNDALGKIKEQYKEYDIHIGLDADFNEL